LLLNAISASPGVPAVGFVGNAVSRIREIESIPLRFELPPGSAYGSARGLAAVRQTTVVIVRTDDGVEGVGEAWGPPGVSKAYMDLVTPYFVGQPVCNAEALTARIFSENYHFGVQNQMVACLSAIDMAALDAFGKTTSQPVCALLGGQVRDELPIYASGGYFTEGHAEGFQGQLELLRDVDAPAYKIKIGANPACDAIRVEEARRVLGDDVLLLVDSNGNYTVDLALESMARIGEYGIGWYEEPLPPQDFAGYARLRSVSPVPIAAGEALYTAWDFKRLIDLGCVDVVQPDVSLCGGLHTARDVALMARLNNLRTSPHVWGGAISLAAACHLMASLPTFPGNRFVAYPNLLEYDVGPNPLRENLLKEPLVADKGYVRLPEGPGLGIEIDPSALDEYRMD
jgi:D-galactarolactone cycloisomerase